MDKPASILSEEAPKERHSTFYFKDDPMVIFLVENQLFKVHRHYLIQDSKVFRDMFSVPPVEGAEVEGMSDDRPIYLPDVSVKEFELLLNHFYKIMRGEPCSDTNKSGIMAPPPQEEQLSLLGISLCFRWYISVDGQRVKT